MKMNRVFLLILFSLLASYGFSWTIISLGGNVYYGNTGFMFGGGAAAEFGFESCFTGEKGELTTFGVGIDYIGGPTQYTQSLSNGMVLSLTTKEGFILAPGNILLNFGLGGAMVMLDIEYEDSPGVYDTTSAIGGAIFGEAAFYYQFPSSRLCLLVCLRGGASFFTDSTTPFFGLKLHLGFIFASEEERNDY